jgi:zona occludens toxin (predicted ATPase)
VIRWAYAWTVILALWIWVYLEESPMIELYEGVPGSGKSYHAICEKFLPWVKQGRRLYIAVDGIYLDRLALFTGIELAALEQQITIWKDSVEVLQAFPHVEPGSAVIIDERRPSFGPCRRWNRASCAGSKPIGITAWIFCS